AAGSSCPRRWRRAGPPRPRAAPSGTRNGGRTGRARTSRRRSRRAARAGRPVVLRASRLLGAVPGTATAFVGRGAHDSTGAGGRYSLPPALAAVSQRGWSGVVPVPMPSGRGRGAVRLPPAAAAGGGGVVGAGRGRISDDAHTGTGPRRRAETLVPRRGRTARSGLG